MKREVKAALKADKTRLTAEVGENIVSELNSGNVQEAFRHLKGWYKNASETQARPCHQTMERQTDERVELYAERAACGAEFPENGTPFTIDDNPPSEGKLRTAVSQLSHGRCGGASGIRAEHIKAWLRGAKKEEDPEYGANYTGAGKSWGEFVELCTSVWETGTIPQQMSWVVTVLIPKGGGDYRGIGLLEPIWKVLERVMDLRLENIKLHDSLHGCLAGRGTGTGIIEAKLAQQLAHLEQAPFFGVFIDLKKAFDAMDRGRCLAILALHGVGPKMIRLIRSFWETATNVCRAKGNYGRPFKAGRGVTQGGPLWAKLFNIIVDAVVREWMRIMRETLDDSDGQLAARVEALFAIFYVDDGYIASIDAEFLQEALDILVETFTRVGLATNTKKTQAMVCTPGKIRIQLPSDSYRRLREGVAAGEEGKRVVVCHVCQANLQARSLRSHLESSHNISQQVVVPDHLLEERAGISYEAERVGRKVPIRCPFPGCPWKLSSAYMLRRHFRDLHPKDSVVIPWEGSFPRCERCRMQCNPRYPRHIHSQVCQQGVERRTQRDSAITSALALRQLFYVEGEVLEKVESFRYLGRILAQDDDDTRAVRSQIKKARGIWARVGHVLQADNTPPKVSAKFYKAVVQSVLLYSSETWNLTKTVLARLEGFHIRAAYRMAKKHKPRKGLNQVWVYPATEDVLKECGMHSILHYIGVRRETIFRFVVDRPKLKMCMEGERRRGSAPRQWWWEQKMCLDDEDTDGAGK